MILGRIFVVRAHTYIIYLYVQETRLNTVRNDRNTFLCSERRGRYRPMQTMMENENKMSVCVCSFGLLRSLQRPPPLMGRSIGRAWALHTTVVFLRKQFMCLAISFIVYATD